jgi:putative SOS response-associated peptidase YedK
MCGRFAIGDTQGTDWRDWLLIEPEVDWPTLGWPPPGWPSGRWNVAPTDPVGFVRLKDGRREAAVGRWGLVPHWWRKPVAELKAATFNARAEEAAAKPMFRDAWVARRCLVPAIGYYEWAGPKGDKTPWFITMRRNTPGILFAGLWAAARVDGEWLLSCTILTTEAGPATRHLHPRSPVVLTEEAAERWLLAPDASLMRSIPDDRVDMWPVDRAVGQVRNDGPELAEPVGLGI